MIRSALWAAFFAARNLEPEWRMMDAFRRLRPEEARLELAKRLQSQIRYFAAWPDALPEWRAAARIEDPLELWGCWADLPIVTKDMLRTRFSAHELRMRLKIPGIVSSTGGSTGEPVRYFHDRRALRSSMAALHYSRMRMGWQPGMSTICIWGSERDIGRQRSLRGRASAFLRGDYLIAGYGLGSATVNEVLRLIARHKPVALYGFTSMLDFVAREVVRAGRQPLPGAVAVAWNGGEMLSPEQAELFRAAFHAPIHNLYGGRELGTMAHQIGGCGPLHILRPYVFLEIVDCNGSPSKPGEMGRLLCTSTACRGTPFLRYEIGDAASYSPADRDDAGIHALAQLHGRTAGLIELRNGKVINCLYWNHLFKEFSEVRQFQVVVRKTGAIDLLLAGDGFSPDRERRLRSICRQFLGETPNVSWTARIPLTAQGKLLQVVRE